MMAFLIQKEGSRVEMVLAGCWMMDDWFLSRLPNKLQLVREGCCAQFSAQLTRRPLTGNVRTHLEYLTSNRRMAIRVCHC